MLLLEAPVFSLTKELVVFAIFVVFVIVLVLATEVEYKRHVEKEKSRRGNVATSDNLFEKVEEFRHDFDGDRPTS